MNDLWTQQNRDLLDEILNQLIPANAGKSIPSAGDAGVGDFIGLRAANDVAVLNAINELLSSAASMEGNVNPEMVSQLEAGSAKNFLLLVNLTYMGYYSRPDIRLLVGVGSWPVHPKGYDVPIEPIDMIEKLTAPVRKRGPVYRQTRDKQQVRPL